jgi:hypothetical protein
MIKQGKAQSQNGRMNEHIIWSVQYVLITVSVGFTEPGIMRSSRYVITMGILGSWHVLGN